MDNTLMAKTILEMASTIGKIDGTTSATKDKVDAHDALLQEHTIKLNDINQRTYHLDSWKNGIIDIVTAEKEKALQIIRLEMKPVQDDLKKRLDTKEENKSKAKDTVFEIAKVGIIAGATWILAKGKALFAVLITMIK